MSIKFENVSSINNGIKTTQHLVHKYDMVYDKYFNAIATDLTTLKTEVSSDCKSLVDSKFYVYCDRNGVPCSMEHETRGEIGELTFDKKRLVDYDGCYSLPKEIGKLLRVLGYTVPHNMM